MAGINGIDPRKLYTGYDVYDNNDPTAYYNAESVSAFGNGYVHNDGMGVTLQSNPANPVKGGEETEPQTNVEKLIAIEDAIQDAINNMICKDETLMNKVKAELEKQDSYVCTYRFEDNKSGFQEIEVTFRKDGDNIVAKGKLPYVITYNPPIDQNGQKLDAITLKAEDQKQFNDWSQELTNPLTTPEKKAEIRTKMLAMLENQYSNVVHTKGFGGHEKTFIDPDYHKRAKETVNAVERLAKFIGREVIFTSAATPEFYTANQKLEEEKAEAQARIDKALKDGEKPDPADLAILNKSCAAIGGLSMSFVNAHKELFIKDGKFDSEMFKNFAAVLAGEDGLLTVEERKNAENRFMMRANDAAREIQKIVEDNGNDASVLSPEQKELFAFYERGDMAKWLPAFIKKMPLGMVQAQIVRDAGLEAKTNIKPLLTIATIALGLGIDAAMFKMTTQANATILFNGEVIAEGPSAFTTITSDMLAEGDNTLLALANAKTNIESTLFSPAALTTAGYITGHGAQRSDFAYNTPIKGAYETKEFVLDCCDEPAPATTPTDDNVTVIHDNQGNEVKFTGCAEDGERGCGDVTRGNIVRDATPDEIKAKYGDNYDKNKTYKVSLQRWQLERAFGIDKAPKELRPILRKAMIEQVLGGNTVVPTGKNVTLLTCFDYIDKNGNVQKWDMDVNGRGQEYWRNMKPDVYSLDANVKYISGRTIPTVHVKDGHADATVTVNGVSRTFSADALDGNGETAIQMVKDQILKAYPEHPEYADAAVAKMRECQQNPKCK